MSRNTVITATISAVIATLIYILVQFIYDRRFESAETVFFAIVAWIVFLITNYATEKISKAKSKTVI